MSKDVQYQGGWFAQRGLAMYKEVERLTPFDFFVSQGGYNTGGVSASAGTHDREAVDISGSILTPDERWTVVTNMRRVGWAAWIRTPAQGFSYHIHGIPINGDLSTAARAQVVQYTSNPPKNGLAGGGPDDGPSGYYDMTWEKYQNSSAYRPPIDIEEDPLAAWTKQEIKDIVNDELQSFFNNGTPNGEGFDRIIQAANKSLEQSVRALVNDEMQSFFDHRPGGPNGEGFDRIVQAVNEALKQSGVT